MPVRQPHYNNGHIPFQHNVTFQGNVYQNNKPYGAEPVGQLQQHPVDWNSKPQTSVTKDKLPEDILDILLSRDDETTNTSGSSTSGQTVFTPESELNSPGAIMEANQESANQSFGHRLNQPEANQINDFYKISKYNIVIME